MLARLHEADVAVLEQRLDFGLVIARRDHHQGLRRRHDAADRVHDELLHDAVDRRGERLLVLARLGFHQLLRKQPRALVGIHLGIDRGALEFQPDVHLARLRGLTAARAALLDPQRRTVPGDRVEPAS